MASDCAILTFLEHIKKGKKNNAEGIIPLVKKEIKIVNKLQIHENGESAIDKLKKVVKLVKSDKFVLVQRTDVDYVTKEFDRYIKRKLKDAKDEAQSVADLPNAVGKIKPMQQRPSTGNRNKTKKAASTSQVCNDDQEKSSSRSSEAIEGSLPQTNKRNSQANGEKHTARKTPSRKQSRSSDKTEHQVLDNTDIHVESEVSVDEKKSNKEDGKQNTEINQTESKEKNVYAIIIKANDPQRVKVMFESLHENEWMDALGVLQTLFNATDAVIAGQLIEIVKMAYRLCQAEAHSQFEQIKAAMRSIVSLGKPDHHQKTSRNTRDADIKKTPGDVDMIIQYRLLHAHHALDNLYSKFKTEFPKEIGIDPRVLKRGDFVKYLEKCVEVTWLMCLQDPPTSLYPTERFIPSLYKPPPGKNYHDVDYIEWPALMYRERVLALGEVRYKRTR